MPPTAAVMGQFGAISTGLGLPDDAFDQPMLLNLYRKPTAGG
jgi:hypothetical protein